MAEHRAWPTLSDADLTDPVTRELVRRVAAGWMAPDAVGLRQVPATASIVLALVAVEATITPAHPPLLAVAAVLVAGVQIAGVVVPWGRFPPIWRAILPLGQMAAVALLDVGAGLPRAEFDILLIFPMGMLALRPARWGPALALAGCAVVLLVPAVVDVGRVRPVLHAVVTFLVLAPAALGAHSIVQATRLQAIELQRARDALSDRARQLQDSRDTLRSIMRAATEQGIIATDPQGVVLSVSTGAERVLGRDTDQLVGSVITDLVPPDPPVVPEPGERGSDAALRRLVGPAAHGGTQVHEWRTALPDGTAHDLELVVTPRPALAGTAPELPAGYLVVATDVTARREEQRQQDAFIGLVGHELRTPLASIIGYVDLLRLDDASFTDEQRRYLAVVERNAARLRLLVDDLLASAQMVAGAPMSAQEVDVVDVVRAAVAANVPIAAAAGVGVDVEADPVVPLTSDPQRLQQVVDNLLSNAVKYSLAGGRVLVQVGAGTGSDGARTARLRVVDEGTGIEQDELARITERFYRSRETRRRRVRGVGLGLSLVQSIVDDHGGVLTITSEPGVGTQVEVVLPDLPDPTA
ncbi:cell wall metabolism sensor histidine kinase WalK [Cellulomonas sp. KH9]|uniref:sensor histidine kinase n=1 Tax=Cellulomonas sp. KH9 TaxID=1855324 RepID=UPI0008ECE417|nr:PAS domain-containing sensor histidine kinase [Cellulomonas sp. KH9]SFK46251.1 PAS domain S-box-containing protein [Cellulomonas sp. KH9]